MSLQVKIDDFYPKIQPRGLENLQVVTAFDYTQRTLLTTADDTELEFIGDAYTYLLESLNSLGYQAVHDITIFKEVKDAQFTQVFSGKLYLSDCVFNLKKYVCRGSIVDGSYDSFVKNNLEIKTNIGIAKSKNGETIDAISPIDVEMINPPSGTIPATGFSTAVTSSTTRPLWDVRDVLSFFTQFMSDGQLTYVSDHLDALADNNVYFGITTGYNLRTNDTEVKTTVSFLEVLNTIGRAENLISTIDIKTGTPLLRIENVLYFQNTETTITKDNIRDIERSYAQELLYSNISVGGSEAITDGSYGALSYLPPFDFKKDNYYITGKSNIRSSLDLTFDFIADSNIIEKILVDNDEGYDDKYIIICYSDNSGTWEAKNYASDIFNDGGAYYNGNLINKAIVQKYKLQGACVKTQGDASGDLVGFYGGSTDTLMTGLTYLGNTFSKRYGKEIVPLFNNITSDPSGAWDSLNQKYTAVASGVRNIRYEVKTRVHNTASGFYYVVSPRLRLNGTAVLLYDNVILWPYLGFNLISIDKQERCYWANPGFESIRNTVYNVSIWLDAGDDLQFEHGLFIHTGVGIDKAQASTTQGVLVSDQGEQGTPDYFSPSGVTAYIETLPSTSVVIEAQGSLNGVTIGTEAIDETFVNKFRFTDYLSAQEIASFLESPEKAIILQNNEYALNTKVWAFNVAINLESGKTEFETFNNIVNL